MRNIRPFAAEIQGDLYVDIQTSEATVRTNTASWQDRPSTGLSQEQMALIRPAWADFDMEPVFWNLLRRICEAEGMSDQDFVADIQIRYPAIPPDEAIRTAIVLYVEWRASWLPHVPKARNRRLHETPVEQLALGASASVGFSMVFLERNFAALGTQGSNSGPAGLNLSEPIGPSVR